MQPPLQISIGERNFQPDQAYATRLGSLIFPLRRQASRWASRHRGYRHDLPDGRSELLKLRRASLGNSNISHGKTSERRTFPADERSVQRGRDAMPILSVLEWKTSLGPQIKPGGVGGWLVELRALGRLAMAGAVVTGQRACDV